MFTEGGSGSSVIDLSSTHPVTVALAATFLHLEHGHVLTLLVQTRLKAHSSPVKDKETVPPGLRGRSGPHLAGAAGGALGHGGGVRHVVPQVEEGSPADQVAVVEAHGGGEDLCVGAQQGALPPTPTLDTAAVRVTATDRK